MKYNSKNLKETVGKMMWEQHLTSDLTQVDTRDQGGGGGGGGVSQNLSSVTNAFFFYKLLISLLLIGYQQIFHWFLSFVIEKKALLNGSQKVSMAALLISPISGHCVSAICYNRAIYYFFCSKLFISKGLFKYDVKKLRQFFLMKNL